MFESSFWTDAHPGLIPYRSRAEVRKADQKAARDEYRNAAKRAPATATPAVSSPAVPSTTSPATAAPL